MDYEEGLFDVVKLMLNNQFIFKSFRINLNAQHVNGMTFFRISPTVDDVILSCFNFLHVEQWQIPPTSLSGNKLLLLQR